MAKEDDKKRNLKFNSFDEMFADMEHLLDCGYTASGNWNLSQTCGHVGNWMSYPVDGFPVPPIFMRPIFWIMKVTVGQSMKRKILAEGFKGGMPTAPESVPAADKNSDSQAVEDLKATVARVSSYSGDLHPSPLFGPMDLETLKKVTLLHAEHHLAYLEPKSK